MHCNFQQYKKRKKPWMIEGYLERFSLYDEVKNKVYDFRKNDTENLLERMFLDEQYFSEDLKEMIYIGDCNFKPTFKQYQKLEEIENVLDKLGCKFSKLFLPQNASKAIFDPWVVSVEFIRGMKVGRVHFTN